MNVTRPGGRATHVLITLEGRQPPSGRLVVIDADDDAELLAAAQRLQATPGSESFTGWLGLIAKLSSLVDPPDETDDEAPAP